MYTLRACAKRLNIVGWIFSAVHHSPWQRLWKTGQHWRYTARDCDGSENYQVLRQSCQVIFHSVLNSAYSRIQCIWFYRSGNFIYIIWCAVCRVPYAVCGVRCMRMSTIWLTMFVEASIALCRLDEMSFPHCTQKCTKLYNVQCSMRNIVANDLLLNFVVSLQIWIFIIYFIFIFLMRCVVSSCIWVEVHTVHISVITGWQSNIPYMKSCVY